MSNIDRAKEIQRDRIDSNLTINYIMQFISEWEIATKLVRLNAGKHGKDLSKMCLSHVEK